MGIFDRILKSNRRVDLKQIGEAPSFANPMAYRNAVVREAVDAVARHAGKLRPRVMQDGSEVSSDLAHLLMNRPNPVMNTYDLLYKTVTTQQLKNNAYVFVLWKRGRVAGLYPVDYISATAEEDANTGALMIHFMLKSGREFWADYRNLIHLRRFYYEKGVQGEDNGPMNDAVEMVNASTQGTVSAIKSGSSLRGILKVTKKALDPKEVKKRKDEFVNDYANLDNTSGIAGLDADMEYTPIDPSKLYSVKSAERQQIKDEVYSYFGVNSDIVMSRYDENQWSAFYESVLEPIAVQLSLEMTEKLLLRNEVARGVNIVVEANRLQYASSSTKTQLAQTLGMMGVITINEMRELFNMPPIAEGEKIIQNWNQSGGENDG